MQVIKQNVEENMRENVILNSRKILENVAFKIVQLTFLQGEIFSDSKNLLRAVEQSVT